jgi:hypothetical protein
MSGITNNTGGKAIHPLVSEHLVELQQTFDLCTTELIIQSYTCPTMLDLSNTDGRLLVIRQKQMKTFEDMTMFKVTIVCKSLLRSINDIDKMIPIDNAMVETPVDTNSSQRQVTQRH